jgi:hypothetical protein
MRAKPVAFALVSASGDRVSTCPRTASSLSESRSAQLAEDVVRAHDRILEIRPALALEAQRLGDVERDDLAA